MCVYTLYRNSEQKKNEMKQLVLLLLNLSVYVIDATRDPITTRLHRHCRSCECECIDGVHREYFIFRWCLTPDNSIYVKRKYQVWTVSTNQPFAPNPHWNGWKMGKKAELFGRVRWNGVHWSFGGCLSVHRCFTFVQRKMILKKFSNLYFFDGSKTNDVKSKTNDEINNVN